MVNERNIKEIINDSPELPTQACIDIALLKDALSRTEGKVDLIFKLLQGDESSFGLKTKVEMHDVSLRRLYKIVTGVSTTVAGAVVVMIIKFIVG